MDRSGKQIGLADLLFNDSTQLDSLFNELPVMGTQVVIFKTGTGSPEVIANLTLADDYQPIKGDLLRLNNAWYTIGGYVKISQKGKPTIISMTVFPIRKIDDGTN